MRPQGSAAPHQHAVAVKAYQLPEKRIGSRLCTFYFPVENDLRETERVMSSPDLAS